MKSNVESLREEKEAGCDSVCTVHAHVSGCLRCNNEVKNDRPNKQIIKRNETQKGEIKLLYLLIKTFNDSFLYFTLYKIMPFFSWAHRHLAVPERESVCVDARVRAQRSRENNEQRRMHDVNKK